MMAESIKLSRELMSGRSYRYAARFKLFVTLIFMAAVEEHSECGVVVRRGELVTTVARLVELTMLTTKQVRRALEALSKAGLILIATTPRHTVVTICNFDNYLID